MLTSLKTHLMKQIISETLKECDGEDGFIVCRYVGQRSEPWSFLPHSQNKTNVQH